nr:MAG TPA: hypothetical protein [Caudoviricetes sp.]
MVLWLCYALCHCAMHCAIFKIAESLMEYGCVP